MMTGALVWRTGQSGSGLAMNSLLDRAGVVDGGSREEEDDGPGPAIGLVIHEAFGDGPLPVPKDERWG
jgi:hypothetical protein